MYTTPLAAGLALLVWWSPAPVAAGPAPPWALVEEVVTSAEKRPRTVARTAGAISTLDGERMADRRRQRIGDLAEVVPNVDVKYSFGNQNPVVTIRGVGLNDFNANNSPPVGVYVDYPKPPAGSVRNKRERRKVMRFVYGDSLIERGGWVDQPVQIVGVEL